MMAGRSGDIVTGEWWGSANCNVNVPVMKFDRAAIVGFERSIEQCCCCLCRKVYMNFGCASKHARSVVEASPPLLVLLLSLL